ncbi:MAG: hypothetical protein V7K89_28835 [Nostoc sp.]
MSKAYPSNFIRVQSDAYSGLRQRLQSDSNAQCSIPNSQFL